MTSSYQTDAGYLDALRIPGRALVDIGAQYDFGAMDKSFAGTTLRVNVTNLFDKEYVSHCLNITGGSCNYGAGRAITASLKYVW
jgi:iron complex outermembrane receptor protein